VPLDPDVIVTQGTELVAVHGHVLPVVTCTVLNATADVSVTLVVESCAAQAGAACVIENSRPPIVSVAERDPLVVLVAVE
jgi:hypothetical protein